MACRANPKGKTAATKPPGEDGPAQPNPTRLETTACHPDLRRRLVTTAFDNGRACYDAICDLKLQAESAGAELSDQIDIIITDIEMPQMDGLTLCKKCKRELNLLTPVVLFSSLINDQMARKCESVGADNYVSKPEIEKLIAILDRHCLDDQAVAVAV